MNPLIIGIGNPYRSDDGVGSAVLGQLQHALQGRADLLDCTGDPSGLLTEWQGRKRVIVIDACQHDTESAGKIFRLNGLVESLPAGGTSTSSHAFSIADVIKLARQLDALPDSLTLYAVVGDNFSSGNILSAPVRQAVDDVCRRVLKELTTGD